MVADPNEPGEPTVEVDPPTEGPPAPGSGFSPGSRYTLLEPLGRGAAGVVYAAHDRELDRRVAIKLLRSEGDGSTGQLREEAQARLTREARALARLAHPNVAQVYDVGVYGPGELLPSLPELADEDELPAARGVFIVMELVDGESLRRWLARGPRPFKELLELLLAAGRGLAAAHDAGLVHRDFKPGNVLLGGDGRVRVVDFGLARAATKVHSGSSEPGEELDFNSVSSDDSVTRTGTVLGTPSYMAPEQHRGEPATEASDQFAFCVVAYEAICGRRPFRGKALKQLQVQKESEAATLPVAGVNVPRWVWPILQRGLAADPERRFGSMRELLERIESARRARRRKLVAAIAVPAIVVAGLAAVRLGAEAAAARECSDQRAEMVGIWDEGARERARSAFSATQLPYATALWESSSSHVDAYVTRWMELRDAACLSQRSDDVAKMEFGNWSVACLEEARGALDAVQKELVRATARTVEGALEMVSKLPDLERCGSPAVALVELERTAQERSHRAVVERALTSSDVSLHAARFEEALAAATEALAEARKAGLHDTEGRALDQIARIQIEQGDTDAAEISARAAWTAAESGDDQDVATRAQVLLLHLVGGHAARLEEADSMVAPLEARVRRRDKQDQLSLEFFRALGSLRERQGKYEEALRAFETAQKIALSLFGAGSLEAAQAIGAIGFIHFRMGTYVLAREHFSEAHSAYARILGDSHPRTAGALERSAVALAQGGDLPAAIATLREAVVVLERALPSRHRKVVNAVGNLAILLHKAGQEEEALAVNQRALDLEASLTSTESAVYGLKLGNHALILRALERREEALAALEKQLAVYQRAYEPDHVDLGTVHVNLASVLIDLTRFDLAETHAKKALEIHENGFGPSHDAVATTLAVLCSLELERGQPRQARPVCRRGLSIYDGLEGFEDLGLLGDLAFGLARALPPSQRKQARDLALRARDAFAAANDPEARTVESWMQERGIDFGVPGVRG
jgi:serine/threonine-protein kinase